MAIKQLPESGDASVPRARLRRLTRMGRRLRRVGLLGRFTLVSAVLVSILGLFLSGVLQSTIEDRALRRAERLAQSIGGLAVEPLLRPNDFFAARLGDERLFQLDREIKERLRSTEDVSRVKLFSTRGVVVYSDELRLVGTPYEQSPEKEAAFAGEVVSRLAQLDASSAEHRYELDLGAQLEVYVPVRMKVAGQERILGVLELYFPFAPVAEEIAADKMVLRVALSAGLLILWLGLHRFVSKASRRLRAQAAENRRLARRDYLTGVASRMAFIDRTGKAIEAARAEDESVAVLLIDINRFKEVNDTLGHHVGDALLRGVADRLTEQVRDEDTIARLGGDEFAVLMNGVDEEDAHSSALRILKSIREPFQVEEIALEVDASIGLALYPKDADDPGRLLQCADVAMYAAKGEQSGLSSYDPALDEHTPQRLALFGELRRAIEGGELVLHYQPKSDIASGRITGVEALVRWQHPERGLLYPDQFIELAEHTGLIRPLTTYVLDRALKDCRAWRNQGLDLTVAVNLSSRNLLDPTLPGQVDDLLAKHDLPADALEIEITESTAMADPERSVQVLAQLHGLGIHLAVDDYGTGHSSLAYLSRLPVDALKIDRSFVQQMGLDAKSDVIVRSTVDLARNLGLRVVAEGVEETEIYVRLAELGCDAAQGYWLARPGPVECVTEEILAVERRLDDLAEAAAVRAPVNGARASTAAAAR